MITIKGENYITTQQAARITDLTAHLIQDLARSGALEAQKIGAAWAISEKSVRAYNHKPKRKSPSLGKFVRAAHLGHKMRRDFDGRVRCVHCQAMLTAILRDELECEHD